MEFQLIDFVDKMIGEYSSFKNPHLSKQTLLNLCEVEVLIDHIIEKLIDNTNVITNVEMIELIGKQSRRILFGIRERINELECE